MSNQVLKFKLGEEYKARVEKPGEFGESLFRDVYENAYKEVETIISSKSEKINGDYEKYNNIIAFVGERGTGKTSCMISFAESLRNINKIEDVKLTDYKNLNKSKFVLTDVIDPSLLAENSNILEIILANMFKRFKEEVPKRENKQDEKRKVLKAFTEVYDNLKTIYSTKEELFKNDGIDVLLKLSASSDLKNNMFKLVDKYLDFIVDEKEKKKNLVIQVDDIDINTKHAYEMVEQIRKYLVIPNVVILMAVKLDQLSDIIKQNYLFEYKELLRRREITLNEINDMTEKYLKKIVPQGRRLYLPTLDNINQASKVQIGGKDRTEGLEEYLLDLIYRKTGMIFLKQDYGMNLIVPNNLREIVNIFTMLYPLKDKDEATDEELKNNLNLFKNYFFETWINNNLDKKNEIKIKELLKKEINEKNKFTVQLLGDILKEADKDDDLLGNSEFRDIVNKENESINISLGDVLYLLKLVKDYKIDYITHKFIFSIKTTYSFMLYEEYLIYKGIKEVSKEKEGKLEEDKKRLEAIENRTIIENKELEEIEKDLEAIREKLSDYLKLFGGLIHNSASNRILASKREKGVIGYSKFKEILEGTSEIIRDENKEVVEKIVYLLHFFLVTNKRRWNSDKEGKRRQYEEAFYDVSLDITGNLIGMGYDIFSFLYNSIDAKRHLRRYMLTTDLKREYGETLYDYYHSKKVSIENESSTFIGNIEIIEKITSRNYKSKSSGKFYDHFKTFIKKLYEFEILDLIIFKDDKIIKDLYEIFEKNNSIAEEVITYLFEDELKPKKILKLDVPTNNKGWKIKEALFKQIKEKGITNEALKVKIELKINNDDTYLKPQRVKIIEELNAMIFENSEE